MSLKRISCIALAIMLAVSCLLFGGCSTPKVALQVNDKTYEMGDYLAYLYSTLYTDQQAYMYLYYYGADAFSQKVSYGTGDEAKEMTLDDYVVQVTQDTMIRQKALEELLKKYNLEWDKDQLKEIETDLKDLKADQFLDLGFNNQRYIDMYKAVYLNESSLFVGLYDDGGLREVSDEDERKWFDEHYYSYKAIEISLVDSETQKELSADKVTAIEKQLQGYLELYNKNGKNGDAFDVAYRKYLADSEASGSGSSSTTTTTTTTTTATTTTTTTAASSDASTTTTATGSTQTEEEAPATATRNDVIDEDMDEELLKVIKAMAEGECAIKTYQKNGTTKTMALILRMDPEAERGKDKDGNAVDYYKDSHDQTLQYMKYDEFNKEVEDTVKTLNVTVNKAAIKAADPKDMVM